MARSVVVSVVAAAALLGCARPTARVSHVIGNEGGLSWSNAPMVIEQRQPVLVDGIVEVSYTLLLENAGKAQAQVVLSRSLALVDDVRGTASTDCHVFRGAAAGDYLLLPRRRARVDCRVRLSETGLRRLDDGHAVLTLAIPVLHGGKWSVLAVPFHLHGGDGA